MVDDPNEGGLSGGAVLGGVPPQAAAGGEAPEATYAKAPKRRLGVTTVIAGIVALFAVAALIVVLVVRDDGSSSTATTTTVRPAVAGPVPRTTLTDGEAKSVKLGSQGTALATYPAIFGRPVAVDVQSGHATIDKFQDATGEHAMSTGRVVIPPGSGAIALVVQGNPGDTVKLVAHEYVPTRLALGKQVTGEVGSADPLAVYVVSLDAPARLKLDFAGATTRARVSVVDSSGAAVSDLEGHSLSGTGDHFAIVEWLGRDGASSGKPPTESAKYQLTVADAVGTLEFDAGTTVTSNIKGSDRHSTLHLPPNVGAVVTLTPSPELRAGVAVTCDAPAGGDTPTTSAAPTEVVVPDDPGVASTAPVSATAAAQTCDVVVSAGTSDTVGDFTLGVAPG